MEIKMYSGFPIKSDVSVALMGQGIEFQFVSPASRVPTKCQDFLDKLGWTPNTQHPDTGETLFQKLPPQNCTDEVRNDWNHDLQYSYWHWYEAMAYEFGKFMGIDEDTSPNTISQDGASGLAMAPAGVPR